MHLTLFFTEEAEILKRLCKMLRKQGKGEGEARKEERESMHGHKYISNQLSIRKPHAGNQHSSCLVERLGTEPLL